MDSKSKTSGVFDYFRGNYSHHFFPRFFLSVCEVMFSYLCFDSEHFCWKTACGTVLHSRKWIDFPLQFLVLHLTCWMCTTVIFYFCIGLRQSSSINRYFYHGKTSWASQKMKSLSVRSPPQDWGIGKQKGWHSMCVPPD